MPPGDLIHVHCELSRGGFSHERVFRLATVQDVEFVGTASLRYCRSDQGEPLPPEVPPEEVRVPGQVAARIITEGGTGV